MRMLNALVLLQQCNDYQGFLMQEPPSTEQHWNPLDHEY